MSLGELLEVAYQCEVRVVGAVKEIFKHKVGKGSLSATSWSFSLMMKYRSVASSVTVNLKLSTR